LHKKCQIWGFTTANYIQFLYTVYGSASFALHKDCLPASNQRLLDGAILSVNELRTTGSRNQNQTRGSVRRVQKQGFTRAGFGTQGSNPEARKRSRRGLGSVIRLSNKPLVPPLAPYPVAFPVGGLRRRHASMACNAERPAAWALICKSASTVYGGRWYFSGFTNKSHEKTKMNWSNRRYNQSLMMHCLFLWAIHLHCCLKTMKNPPANNTFWWTWALEFHLRRHIWYRRSVFPLENQWVLI